MGKLTKPQEAILERVRADGALMRQEDGFSFISGETAHARVVRNLIEKGEIVESKDSLFPDAPGQTLRSRK